MAKKIAVHSASTSTPSENEYRKIFRVIFQNHLCRKADHKSSLLCRRIRQSSLLCRQPGKTALFPGGPGKVFFSADGRAKQLSFQVGRTKHSSLQAAGQNSPPCIPRAAGSPPGSDPDFLRHLLTWRGSGIPPPARSQYKRPRRRAWTGLCGYVRPVSGFRAPRPDPRSGPSGSLSS